MEKTIKLTDKTGKIRKEESTYLSEAEDMFTHAAWAIANLRRTLTKKVKPYAKRFWQSQDACITCTKRWNADAKVVAIEQHTRIGKECSSP